MSFFRGRPRRLTSAALSTLVPTLAFIGVSCVASRGHAEEAPLGTHQRHVRLDAGLRVQFVGSEGLDPFAENDAVTQFTTSASYAFFARDRLSVAGALFADLGGVSSTVRGAETSLDLYRVGLGPELRYHVLRLVAATLRVSPTLSYARAELEDTAAGSLSTTGLLFGAEATAGVAVEVFGFANPESRQPRLWLTMEGGYGFASALDLELTPEDADQAPVRTEPVRLGELSLSGPLFRIAAAISF